MDNAIEIKLSKRLPNLTEDERIIFTEAVDEAYRKGRADAVETICRGCGYKSYYSQVAAQSDCNDCGKVKECPYVPRPGAIVRINCPLWRAKV